VVAFGHPPRVRAVHQPPLGPDAPTRVPPHQRRDDPARLLAHRAAGHAKKSRIYNEAYFDAVHFWRYFLTEGQPRLIIKAGGQAIIAAGDFPTVQADWPHIGDETFQPVGVPEDDLLTLLAEQAVLAEDDWGAEYEDDEGENT
jgi:hypothetical protein